MFVSFERTGTDIEAVSKLLGTGLSDHEIGRQTGVSRSSVQRWRTRGVPQLDRGNPGAWMPFDPRSYCYLLGIYLGDGYLAHPSPRSTVLEISLDPKYPGIVDECSVTVWRVAGVAARTSRQRTQKGEGIRLAATSPRWAALFPQHGPGRKHQRTIRLVSWQQAIVDRFPEAAPPWPRPLRWLPCSQPIQSPTWLAATRIRLSPLLLHESLRRHTGLVL